MSQVRLAKFGLFLPTFALLFKLGTQGGDQYFLTDHLQLPPDQKNQEPSFPSNQESVWNSFSWENTLCFFSAKL